MLNFLKLSLLIDEAVFLYGCFSSLLRDLMHEVSPPFSAACKLD